MIKILDSNLVRLGVLKHILNASLKDELNGERTLDFEFYIVSDLNLVDKSGEKTKINVIFNNIYTSPSLFFTDINTFSLKVNAITPLDILENTTSSIIEIGPDTSFEVDGQYYDVGYVETSKSENGNIIVRIETDHISYRLNQQIYDLEPYNEETGEGFEDMIDASPSAILSRLLNGTPFIGTIDSDFSAVTFTVSGTLTRRQALLDFVDMIEGEIIYDNFNINIVKHRGSINSRVAIVGKNVFKISKEIDKRTRVEDLSKPPYVLSYNCEIIELPNEPAYMVGDNIRILDHELNIDTIQRVVSITSDPHNEFAVKTILLGDLTRRTFQTTVGDIINGGDIINNIINDPDSIKDIGDALTNDDDFFDTITDKIAENMIPGPEGPPGEQGDPGPKGDKGDDATLEYRNRIQSDGNETYIECTSSNINIDAGSTSYTLDLSNPSGISDNQVLQKDANTLKIAPLSQIGYINNGAISSSISCAAGTLNLRTNDDVYALNFTDANGNPALDGMILTKVADNQIAFSNFQQLQATANIVILSELPAIADAKPGTIYIII